MSKIKIITSVGYILLILSVCVPWIYKFGIWVEINHMALTKRPSDMAGFDFVFILLGMFYCPMIMLGGLASSALLSLFSRNKLLILLAMFALSCFMYAMYIANFSPDRPGDGLFLNTSLALANFSSWLFYIYFASLLLAASCWFVTLFKSRYYPL